MSEGGRNEKPIGLLYHERMELLQKERDALLAVAKAAKTFRKIVCKRHLSRMPEEVQSACDILGDSLLEAESTGSIGRIHSEENQIK